jgi:RNA polymerase primary sigma factor
MRQLKIQASVTNRTEITERYFNEISAHEMITPKEEIELAIKIKQGDQAALDKLVKANLRFVVSVAKQYQGTNGLSIDDLISEGNVGLIEAAKRFDHTRGFKFISYAVWWIRQSIFLAMSDKTNMIRIPLNKKGQRLKLQHLSNSLEQKFHREPTVEELKEHMDFHVSDNDMEYVLGNYGKAFSLDRKINEDENLTYLDLMADMDQFERPDASVIAESQKKILINLINTLKPVEKDVIINYFGIGGVPPKIMEEIATTHDLTKERVRQIKSKALEKLQRKIKRTELAYN